MAREIPKSTRKKALAEHLGVAATKIAEVKYPDNAFAVGDAEYLVLTDEEADRLTREDVEESLWAFNPKFIVAHSKLPEEATSMVRDFCVAKCEGANDTVRALIVDMDEFVADAIAEDGRGHFLNRYDGSEDEVRVGKRKFFVYRVN